MKNKVIILISIVISVILIIILLFINGIIIPTKLEAKKYEVEGIDVSSYQGDIDWNKIEEQGIKFAFIKATEGSTYVDKYFQKNYENATKTNLVLGIYHFFSFETTGKEQAKNYIRAVGEIKDDDQIMLPIVDFEFYNNVKTRLPKEDEVKRNLKELLEQLEKNYKIKPIIYATMESYEKYLSSEEFLNYDIWIRNLLTKPILEKDKDWTFWQYTNKGNLKGYSGKEKFIDLNVFNGNLDEFNKYIEEKKKEKKSNFYEKEEVKQEIVKKLKTVEAIVKKIENSTFYLKTEENEELKINLNDSTKIINSRTQQKENMTKIKTNDKLVIYDALQVDDSNLELTEKTQIHLIRNISGNELKQELLTQEEIEALIKQVKINRNDIILNCVIDDMYGINNESFEIDIKVTKDTLILGTKENQQKNLEKLKEQRQVYITFDKNKKQEGILVATNIEIMGC